MPIKRGMALTLLAFMLAIVAACGGGGGDKTDEAQPAAGGKDTQPAAQASTNPIDQIDLGNEKVSLVFWHTQSGPNADKLMQVIQGFQQKYPNITIDAQNTGNYTDNYKKLTAAIVGGGLPDLAVSYPSMVSEYQQADKVVALDDYINSQKYGFTREELADFYPGFLEESRYPEYGNKYYSFPFTKSALVMYYNADKLKAEGIKVPETWDEFEAACKKLTKDGAKGYSIEVSASTFDGMVYSRGGKLISDDQKTWKFHEQAGIDSLAMLQRMIREGTAYQAPKAFQDQVDFGKEQIFFTLGSTSGIPFYEKEVGGKFQWGIANIPHAQGVAPVPVLYGGSITVFKSTPQKQLASWLFIKYFSSPEVTADWAPASGYMPVRKSAANLEPVKKRVQEFPAYGVAMNQIVPTAKAETSVAGTQDTRTFIENAVVAAISDLNKNPKDLLAEAAQKGQRALQR